MPDIELFKVIMNGGMFGLWLIFVVWCLWYGAPMIRGVLAQISTDSHNAIVALGEAHKTAMQRVGQECREERREMLERFEIERSAMQETAAKEREEDRKSRHEQGNQMQNVIREAIRIQPPPR